MAETSLKGLASEILLMSDRYERRARLAPGLFVVAPIAVYAYASAWASMSWYQSMGLAVLLESLLALFAGHLSRALGTAAQTRVFPDGLPTHLWLSADGPRSVQQREQWRDALLALTGIDVYLYSDPEEQSKSVADAIAQARVRLRTQQDDKLLRVHNEEYGFARNLFGLVPVWAAAAAITSVAVAVSLFLGGKDWLTLSIEVVFLASSIAYLFVGKPYVKWTAERYAESLLVSVVMASEKAGPSEQLRSSA